MCPNEQVLSAYFDNELEGEWKDTVQKHLDECDKCREKLSGYTSLRNGLQRIDAPDLKTSPKALVTTYVSRYARDPFPKPWERKVGVPFPIVIAASFLMIAMGVGFLAMSVIQPSTQATMPVVDSSDVENIEKLAELIEFLHSQDAVLEMRITLPEDNDFAFSMGEPRLLKAADYQGTQ